MNIKTSYKKARLALVVGSSLLATYGCVTPPNHNYNILSPIQAVLDYTDNTRHFDVVKGDIKTNWESEILTFKKPAKLYKTREWDQVIVKTDYSDSVDMVEYRYKLEDNLMRVCSAIRPDATLQMEDEALRGVAHNNSLNACISEELGSEYPLFVFSWVHDLVVGDYITLIAPTSHYSDNDYACKLKREGYTFMNTLYCSGS